MEESRRSVWARDNVRRKHNYLPFIVELLKGLAQEGKLRDVYETAKTKAVEREEKKKQQKDKAKA